MKLLRVLAAPIVALVRLVGAVVSMGVRAGIVVDRFIFGIARGVLHEIAFAVRLVLLGAGGVVKVAVFLGLAPFRVLAALVGVAVRSAVATTRLTGALTARLAVLSTGGFLGFGLSFLAVKGAASVASEGATSKG